MADEKQVLDEKILERIVVESGVPDKFRTHLRELVSQAFLEGVRYSHANTKLVDKAGPRGDEWDTWSEIERAYKLPELENALEQYKK